MKVFIKMAAIVLFLSSANADEFCRNFLTSSLDSDQNAV